MCTVAFMSETAIANSYFNGIIICSTAIYSRSDLLKSYDTLCSSV